MESAAPAPTGLPTSMQYGMRRAKAVTASCIQRSFAASNGSSFSYLNPDIRIPVSAMDGFLDSARGYLSFTLVNSEAVATMSLSRSAASMIDSIRIESQGVLLERIEKWSVFKAFKDQWSVDLDEQATRNSAEGGPIASLIPSLELGAVLEPAAASSIGVTLQLDCGFLHSFDDRAIPMGSAFEIVIRLASPENQAIWSAAANTGCSVLNPRYFVPLYRIEDAGALQSYNERLMGENGVSWSGPTVKTYTTAVTAATSQTLQINDRSLSLLALLTVQRLTASLAFGGIKTSFTLNGLTQYAYNIDGQSYPQTAVDVSASNMGRVYRECMGILGVKGGPALAAMATAGYASAVDLRAFTDATLSLRGMNTASTAAPNTLSFLGAPSAGEAITFAIAESFWSLRQGRLAVLL